jgi:dihydroxy-acid dehydratase
LKHRLTLEIPTAEMKRRKAKWKKPAPRYRRGVLAKFAASTTSASTGAVTDAGL